MEEKNINNMPSFLEALSNLDKALSLLEKNFIALDKKRNLEKEQMLNVEKEYAFKNEQSKKDWENKFSLSQYENEKLKKAMKEVSLKLDSVISRVEKVSGE